MTIFFGMLGCADRTIQPNSLHTVKDRFEARGFGSPFLLQIAERQALLALAFGDTAPGGGTLDGEIWVAGEIRLDRKQELVADLCARGHQIAPSIDDATLIAYAYREWQTECMKYLLGDFGFVLVDTANSRVLLATDAFSSIPIYWSLHADQFRFSNFLDRSILCPDDDGKLDEHFIGDYLLFGSTPERTSTIHQAIRRVPPASLTILEHNGTVRSERYWHPPAPSAYRNVRHSDEWLDAFKFYLRQAVARRVVPGQTAFTLTAGLDSAVALSIALELDRERGGAPAIPSYCTGFDWLLPDEERHGASLTADALGAQLTCISADAGRGHSWRDNYRHVPEPRLFAGHTTQLDQLIRRVATDGNRVLISGLGGDILLGWRRLSISKLLRSGQLLRSASQTLGNLGGSLTSRQLGRALLGPPLKSPRTFPAAIEPEFAKRLGLHERLADIASSDVAMIDSLQRMHEDSFWSAAISLGRPDYTTLPLRIRHPYFDHDLIKFIAETPPIPWCINKSIIRQLAARYLPPTVWRRKKYALSGSPLVAWAKRRPESDLRELLAHPGLENYVNKAALSETIESCANIPYRDFNSMREYPLLFAHWLAIRD